MEVHICYHLTEMLFKLNNFGKLHNCSINYIFALGVIPTTGKQTLFEPKEIMISSFYNVAQLI